MSMSREDAEFKYQHVLNMLDTVLNAERIIVHAMGGKRSEHEECKKTLEDLTLLSTYLTDLLHQSIEECATYESSTT
jgi:hypothetical protein